jgi:glucose-6-phosphate 1-dehydrogenase
MRGFCYTVLMNTPTILILVGITGDLAKRKLVPAINSLKDKGQLPERFELVGVTRKDDPLLFKMDLDKAEDYLRLKEHLEKIESRWRAPAQRLFYLSVAPTISLPIIEQLGASGLSAIPHTKLLLEKPFGLDLESAEQFISAVNNHFSEEQIYRIDHYLAKDTVRALSRLHIEKESVKRIEISASEAIGIEGRAGFYEQTGALRDFVQSHLLEVAAMFINPLHRLQALKNFFIPTDKEIPSYVRRGQYNGYREAVENPGSAVETKISVSLRSHDPVLEQAEIVVQSGKALDKKSTDITIEYQDGATHVISLNDATNAYENVFTDAISGDKEYFVSKEEVLETWRILAPIQEYWKDHDDDLVVYEEGSPL